MSYDNFLEGQDTTWEFWVASDDQTTNQVIWESGGGADGSSLTVVDGKYRFTIKNGANFLVKWKSPTKVNPPLIEGVMIGTRSGQGISFVSRGQVIDE